MKICSFKRSFTAWLHIIFYYGEVISVKYRNCIAFIFTMALLIFVLFGCSNSAKTDFSRENIIKAPDCMLVVDNGYPRILIPKGKLSKTDKLNETLAHTQSYNGDIEKRDFSSIVKIANNFIDKNNVDSITNNTAENYIETHFNNTTASISRPTTASATSSPVNAVVFLYRNEQKIISKYSKLIKYDSFSLSNKQYIYFTYKNNVVAIAPLKENNIDIIARGRSLIQGS